MQNQIENQIQIGDKIIDIKPIKMKYMKNNFYEYFMIIKQLGSEIFSYEDGIDILKKMLVGVFDGDLEIIEYIISNFTKETFDEFILKVTKINEFEEENLKDKKQDNSSNKDKEDSNKKSGLTLRRGYAMLGVYAGLTENVLDECTFLYYKDCIAELSVKFNWEIAKHILSQPVLSEESAKANHDLINEKHPFFVDINDNNTQKQVSEGNTLEGLKKLGLDIKVAKADDFVPIQDMFKNSQKQNNNEKQTNTD